MKRYNLMPRHDERGVVFVIPESPHGQYVLFADHEAETRALREKVARVEKLLEPLEYLGICMGSEVAARFREALAEPARDTEEK